MKNNKIIPLFSKPRKIKQRTQEEITRQMKKRIQEAKDKIRSNRENK